jgi:hypothetical protein
MAILQLKYKIYCETDSRYEYEILDEADPAPTDCPVDVGHTITTASISIIETISNTSVNEDVPPEHADNAAAKVAGLTNGQRYKTGDLVKAVHD